MKGPRARPKRKSIRLAGYDYAETGAYFVTICAKGKVCLFGEIVDGQMILNSFGKIVESEWLKSAQIRQEIRLDVFQIMPNHIHAIVWIVEIRVSGQPPLEHDSSKHGLRPRSLSSLIAGFESAATTRINRLRGTPGKPVWQRSFHDRIIRSERELHATREYIKNNPKNWPKDSDNPYNPE